MTTRSHERRTRRRSRGRARVRSLGIGITAVVSTGMVVAGVPAARAAQTVGTDSGGQRSSAALFTQGHETTTKTPSMVTGLHDKAQGTVGATAAARAYLGSKKAEYHIADPRRDLAAAGAQSDKGDEVVRLQQRYQGVKVLGGEYVVRMEKSGAKRTVTGTSGKYYTGLDLDTVLPKVSAKVAADRAVAAVMSRLDGGPLRRNAAGGSNREPSLRGRSNGLVILPQGSGVLTRHITVSGVNPADGSPVKQEVYVDAHSGFPLLQYSSIQTFGAAPGNGATTDSGTMTGKPRSGRLSAPDDATSQQLVVKGTGVRYNGKKTELNLYQGADGAYQMIDYSKRDPKTPYSGTLISTYDARGVDVTAASGRWPNGVKVFASDTPDLGSDFTQSGAVDAHWAAGKVYDYYKDHFGRKGLDDKDGFINSLVGVTQNGKPYNNAFWDGSKMVYGEGGDGYRTFSADTDVVGHEMTHGVITNSADLVYAGQSGAMNEALADYFGNAIDLEANHESMDDPDSGLMGEDLCTDLPPRKCALRDLDNGYTTSKDFVGVTFRGDSGGVHLNSQIFSGALWDIRHDLGGDLADRIVYRALTAYMTPLDGFTQGRAAVVAAAKELHATKAQRRAIKRDFNAHGIVRGWEKALGVDTDTLVARDPVYNTGVGAGGGKYAVSRSNADGSEPYSVWVGNTNGKGRPRLISGNNGDYNVYADTDGKNVVWADYSANGIRIMMRPVKGGIIKEIGSAGYDISSLAIDGDYVVYTTYDPQFGVDHVRYIDIKTGKTGGADDGTPRFVTGLPSVHDGRIAYAKIWPDRDTGATLLGVEVFDVATGTKTLMPIDNAAVYGVGQTAVTDEGVYWIEDDDSTDNGKAAVKYADLDGSDLVTILPESGKRSLHAYSLTATDQAVTVTDQPQATSWSNNTLPKLYQVSSTGKGKVKRMSCNRGDQYYASADEGKRVVWLDGTTGYTNLVKRDRPAGRC